METKQSMAQTGDLSVLGDFVTLLLLMKAFLLILIPTFA